MIAEGYAGEIVSVEVRDRGGFAEQDPK